MHHSKDASFKGSFLIVFNMGRELREHPVDAKFESYHLGCMGCWDKLYNQLGLVKA
ncbi:Uncharacterized protein TCM_043740 [Theobroma cacao]|uniref:Uncharacterized protein n=1 Tax=Theobroma cacao TaxID=3641 RepID=A0A061FW76_THECC|nr:Uncharacterized protein TCM_043740 [Theobroma cacao]